MKKVFHSIVFVFLFCSFVFAEATFDTTNENTMGMSLQKMMIGLSAADQEKLHQSIASMYMAEGIARMGKATPEQIQNTVGKKLHGKTAKQIIKMAEKVRMKMSGLTN